jgi:conjugative transfer signal peptidase TraF
VKLLDKIVVATMCGGLVALTLAGLAGARINTTKSLARGLYWRTDAPITRGSIVRFCPPPWKIFQEAHHRHYVPSGFCPGGLGYMMKRVAAIPGDVVTTDGDGIVVNGARLLFSAAKAADNLGKPLPRWNAQDYTIRPGELLLMTDVSPNSFDARYFGPVAQSQIVDVMRPVLIFR